MTHPAWKSIADAAPTLADLKKLSLERQIMLLLARLNVMYLPDGDCRWVAQRQHEALIE
jgi:hypothetical protein